ncbi:unnamed protein product [Symbiodinium sp. KB8]|nr:unnamed protein product [Symbiodinium sp. KB8]
MDDRKRANKSPPTRTARMRAEFGLELPAMVRCTGSSQRNSRLGRRGARFNCGSADGGVARALAQGSLAERFSWREAWLDPAGGTPGAESMSSSSDDDDVGARLARFRNSVARRRQRAPGYTIVISDSDSEGSTDAGEPAKRRRPAAANDWGALLGASAVRRAQQQRTGASARRPRGPAPETGRLPAALPRSRPTACPPGVAVAASFADLLREHARPGSTAPSDSAPVPDGKADRQSRVPGPPGQEPSEATPRQSEGAASGGEAGSGSGGDGGGSDGGGSKDCALADEDDDFQAVPAARLHAGAGGSHCASGPATSALTADAGLCVGTVGVEFGPASLEDLGLALHKRKLEELRLAVSAALDAMPAPGTDATVPLRLVVVIGPAGCGKSSAVRLLAGQRGVALSEWADDGWVAASSRKPGSGWGRAGHASVARADEERGGSPGWGRGGAWAGGAGGAATDFAAFLAAAGRAPALRLTTGRAAAGGRSGAQLHGSAYGRDGGSAGLGKSQRRLLLLESLPPQHSAEASEAIRSAFAHFLGCARHPCVLVLSHGDSPFDPPSRTAATRLLGRRVAEDPGTAFVTLPAVPDGRMRACLRRVANLARASARGGRASFAAAGEAVADAVENAVRSAHGDLRHAVAALELALGGRGRGKQAVLGGDPLSRDEAVDSIRAVGRLLYATREGTAGRRGGRLPLRHDLVRVAAECAMDGPMLLAFVADGYVKRLPQEAHRCLEPGASRSEEQWWASLGPRRGGGAARSGAARSGSPFVAGALADALSQADVLLTAEAASQGLDAAREAKDAAGWAGGRQLTLGFDLDSPLPLLGEPAGVPTGSSDRGSGGSARSRWGTAASTAGRVEHSAREQLMAKGRGAELVAMARAASMELPNCMPWACDRRSLVLDRVPAAARILSSLAARPSARPGQSLARPPRAKAQQTQHLPPVARAASTDSGRATPSSVIMAEAEGEANDEDDSAAWLALAQVEEAEACGGAAAEPPTHAVSSTHDAALTSGLSASADDDEWLAFAADLEARTSPVAPRPRRSPRGKSLFKAGASTSVRHSLQFLSLRAAAICLAVGAGYTGSGGFAGSAAPFKEVQGAAAFPLAAHHAVVPFETRVAMARAAILSSRLLARPAPTQPPSALAPSSDAPLMEEAVLAAARSGRVRPQRHANPAPPPPAAPQPKDASGLFSGMGFLAGGGLHPAPPAARHESFADGSDASDDIEEG